MKEFKEFDEKKKEYIIFNGKKNQYIYLSQFSDKKKKAIGDVNFLVIYFLYFSFH